MVVDIETAEGKIIEWKSHILRTINQDKARTQTLHDLQTGDILLIMDWAMKFLPLAFREKQSDWYGQKGINWHVSVCIYKDEDLNLKHRTFAHLMDGVKQDWMTVACLLEDTLHHIKMQLPNIERVFLRSDNAGCYHCGNLWLAIPGISMRTGVFIARYDFSEAQSGKSYCDAKIAHMRGKLCKVAASGHNILSAADMKSALDLYGGTTGCQASHVEMKEMPPSAARYPIKGISRISNVEFERGLMRTWQAYGIGRGKQIPIDHENNDLAVLEIISNFICKSGSVGQIRKPQGIDSSSARDHCFMCPEGGCTQVFNNYSDMQNHCFLGNHTFKLQASSTYDDIKLRWMDACSSLSEDVHKYRNMQEEIASEGSVQTEMGWGLKREKKHVRFTEDIKMYLNEIFQRGENNGTKVHPSVVVQNMRVAKNENGEKRFSPNEYLSVSQILSYFSRLSAMRKTSSKDLNDDDLDAVLLNIAKMETASEFQ
uniref:Uncharacterized protein LOC111129325 n=1 Tax=Crassostrea virginica TaxID=6565 RepID=A0A8B8DTW3_CRAVI|nr:uncharacterized protein LOC111129325 [Crassostrea virginica]